MNDEEQQRRISRPKAIKKQKSLASGIRISSFRALDAMDSNATLANVSTTKSDKSIKPTFDRIRQNIVTMMNMPLVPPVPPISNRYNNYEDREPRVFSEPPPVPRKDRQLPGMKSSTPSTTQNLVVSYRSYRQNIMHLADANGYNTPLDAERRNFGDSVHELISEIGELPDELYFSRPMQASLRRLQMSLLDLEARSDPCTADQVHRNLTGTMDHVIQVLLEKRSLLANYDLSTQTVDLASDEGSEDVHSIQNSSEMNDDPSADETAFESDATGSSAWVSVGNEPSSDMDSAYSNASRLRRSKSSAALLTRQSNSESSLSSDSDEAKVDPPAKIKKTIWERFSPSKKAAAKLGPAPASVTNVTEELNEALELLKEAADGDRTQIDRPDSFHEANHADRNVNEEGKVTDLSARAILYKMCIEHRYPPSSSSDGPETMLTEIIFNSFRIYWTPKEFAAMLREFYLSSKDQSAVVSLVEQWIFEYWAPPDRDDKTGAVRSLASFLGDVVSEGSFEGGADRVLAMLIRISEYASGKARYAIPPIQASYGKKFTPFKMSDFARNISMRFRESKNVSIRDFFRGGSLQEFAKQLTLRESGLIKAIKPSELVNNCIKPGVDADAEQRIVAQREFGNRLWRWAKWVAYKRSTPEKRAEVIDFLCRLTQFLLKLCNYESSNTIYAAICGLSGDFLENLPLTRAALKPKTWDRKAALDKWFKENRISTLSSGIKIAKPTVPILATFAGRLTRSAADRSLISTSSIDGQTVLYNLSILKDAKNVVTAVQHSQDFLYQFPQYKDFQEYLDIEIGRAPDTNEELHEKYITLKAYELDAHAKKIAALEYDN